ncbi:PPC domain-containing DNA-binding protein [Bartonella sp. HY328]|uniref:PPC domain-containing DNA-binding protein n=1 Tax=unclassified Bartonella TaxID=2645622 RepID=UPI003965A260
MKSAHATSSRHIRLSLQPEKSLYQGLVEPLAQLGIKSVSTTILGGYFLKLDYCVAPPDPSKQAVIAYTKPIHAGEAYMVFGNATLGFGLDDKPLVHCHASLRTQSGDVKGGHILTETSIVGPFPISVLVTSFEGFELRQAFDPETNIALLQPYTA